MSLSFMITKNIIFIFFSTGLLISAVMVIVAKQPVFSLLFLVASFLFTSFILFLLECELLALLFIVIYAGAIAILFLFAVMLLESKFTDLSKNLLKYMPIGFFLGAFFLIPMINQIRSQFETSTCEHDFYLNTFQNWYDLIDSTSDIEVFGSVLYTYFVLQFLIVGLILLLVLIGVIYLTNNYNASNPIKKQVIFKQLARESKLF